jgi:hypothetical protein
VRERSGHVDAQMIAIVFFLSGRRGPLARREREERGRSGGRREGRVRGGRGDRRGAVVQRALVVVVLVEREREEGIVRRRRRRTQRHVGRAGRRSS